MLTEKLPEYLVRYDASRGRLTTFLDRRVRGVCEDACAEAQGRGSRVMSLETPVGKDGGDSTLEDILADFQSPDPLDWTISQHEALARAVQTPNPSGEGADQQGTRAGHPFGG